MKKYFHEDRKSELEEHGTIFLKSVDWLFNCKVPHVHCGKIKSLKKKFLKHLQFHYPKKTNIKLFSMYMIFKKQNWLKLCYCNLFGTFYRTVFPY